MNEEKLTHKRIRRDSVNLLLTASDGRIPMLSAMTAVGLWLLCALGIRTAIESVPLEIPDTVIDILQSAVTVPMAVGAVKYIADGCRSTLGCIVAPFESAASYTTAWADALIFPIHCITKRRASDVFGLISLNLGYAWHLLPVILSGGLWLFVFLPYYITANALYLRYTENVDKINNINKTTGEIEANGS